MPTHSPLQSPPGGELKELYDAESSRLRHDFSSTKNGLNYLRERAVLVESVVLRLAEPFLSSEAQGTSGIVLVAVGDFGRRSPFPYSDIDLLFLPAAREGADQWAGAIEKFSHAMLAAGLKINATTKSFAEFGEFDSENAESILSLLDCRYLAGDRELFSNLRDKFIPEVMARESQVLAERLAEMTRNRHRKFANTVFHLEPDVKDGPGGVSAITPWRAGLRRCPPWSASTVGPIRRRCSLPRFAIRWTMRFRLSRPCAAFSSSGSCAMTAC